MVPSGTNGRRNEASVRTRPRGVSGAGCGGRSASTVANRARSASAIAVRGRIRGDCMDDPCACNFVTVSSLVVRGAVVHHPDGLVGVGQVYPVRPESAPGDPPAIVRRWTPRPSTRLRRRHDRHGRADHGELARAHRVPRRPGAPEAASSTRAPTGGSATSCCSSSIRRPDPRAAVRPGPRPGDPGRARRRAASRSIRVERGGEVTYHGPGQLVAYPIVRLARARPAAAAVRRAPSRRRWSRPAPRSASRRRGATATRLLVRPGRRRPPRKIGALGLRVERGVSYHGIALNIDRRPAPTSS